jgi:hypothetical protein
VGQTFRQLLCPCRKGVEGTPLTTRSFGTGFILRVVTVIVFAIFPTDVTIPVLMSGIVLDGV